MKKPIILLLGLTLLISLGYPSYGFFYEVDSNVPIREMCLQELNSIDNFYGVAYIKIHKYPYAHYFDGYAFYNSGITLYDGCNKDILYHELAHLCQNKMFHDKLWQISQHKGNFTNCMEMIKNEA